MQAVTLPLSGLNLVWSSTLHGAAKRPVGQKIIWKKRSVEPLLWVLSWPQQPKTATSLFTGQCWWRCISWVKLSLVKKRILHRFYLNRYSPLSSRLIAFMSHVILNEWLCPFIARIINIHGSGVLVALFSCCMAGATWNCCRLSAVSVYTIQPCTSLQCHFIQTQIKST